MGGVRESGARNDRRVSLISVIINHNFNNGQG